MQRKTVTVYNNADLIDERIEREREQGWRFVRDDATQSISQVKLIFEKQQKKSA